MFTRLAPVAAIIVSLAIFQAAPSTAQPSGVAASRDVVAEARADLATSLEILVERPDVDDSGVQRRDASGRLQTRLVPIGEGGVSPGDRLSYRVIVRNAGDGDATDVSMTFPVPDAILFDGAGTDRHETARISVSADRDGDTFVDVFDEDGRASEAFDRLDAYLIRRLRIIIPVVKAESAISASYMMIVK